MTYAQRTRGRLGVIPLNIQWLDFPVSCLAVFSTAWYRKEGSCLLQVVLTDTMNQYIDQQLVECCLSIRQVSVECQSSIGQMFVKYWLSIWSISQPLLDRYSTDAQPTLDRYSTDTQPTVSRYIGWVLLNTRSILGSAINRLLVDISIGSVDEHYLQ